jgi:hypothetical protein
MTTAAHSQPAVLPLSPLSVGVGDRFGRQAKAQLNACIKAAEAGCTVIPVWNKSNREHNIIGTNPDSVLEKARAAVNELKWPNPFHVDADHISLATVGRFLPSSDYFTLDVADAIGQAAQEDSVQQFLARHPELTHTVKLPCGDIEFSPEVTHKIARKYLCAAQTAGKLYRHIESAKLGIPFVTEVSMDETDLPQTPAELLVILAALADEAIPLQTIAPKFSGRFNKGVDYVGDAALFEKEFRADLAVIAHATQTYAIPKNLKLSIHSGSDKFSIYPAMRKAIREANAGLHLKTAGTTWLEELIGLAEADGEGLSIAKEIYARAYVRMKELCEPYATVIDIDPAMLPSVESVRTWSSRQYTDALRHDQSCYSYNPSFRQLLHVGYKVASELGDEYLGALDRFENTIARNVTTNLYERHIKRVFME